MESLNRPRNEEPNDGLPNHGWESLANLKGAKPGDIARSDDGTAPRVLMDDGKTWARKGGRVERRWNEYKNVEGSGDTPLLRIPRTPADGAERIPREPIGVGESARIFGDDRNEAELLARPEHDIDSELESASDDLGRIEEATRPIEGTAQQDSMQMSDFIHPPLRPNPPSQPNDDRRPSGSSPQRPRRPVAPETTPQPEQRSYGNELSSMMERMRANDPRNIRKLAKQQKEARRQERREKREARQEERRQEKERREKEEASRVYRGETNYREALRDSEPEPFRPTVEEGLGSEKNFRPAAHPVRIEEMRPAETADTTVDFFGPRWDDEPTPERELDSETGYRNEKQHRRLHSFVEKLKEAWNDYKETSYMPDLDHAGETRREERKREEEAQRRAMTTATEQRHHDVRREGEAPMIQRARDYSERFGAVHLDDETRQDFGYRPESGHYFTNSGVDTLEPVVDSDGGGDDVPVTEANKPEQTPEPESNQKPEADGQTLRRPKVEDLFPRQRREKNNSGESPRRRRGTGGSLLRRSRERSKLPAHERYTFFPPDSDPDIGDYDSFL